MSPKSGPCTQTVCLVEYSYYQLKRLKWLPDEIVWTFPK